MSALENLRIDVVADFFVFGKCEPAGSKKAYVRGGRAIVIDANARADGWKKTVAGVALVEMNGVPPVDGPVALHLSFLLARPPSHFRTDGRSLSAAGRRFPSHTQSPDALKLGRAVEDALSGVVYVDDSQIISETLRKRWTVSGERPGVHVQVLRR